MRYPSETSIKSGQNSTTEKSESWILALSKYRPCIYPAMSAISFIAIPLKSPCQPFSLELSNPGVCTQALNLLGFVSPGRAVCQRRVITHRVSLAPLLHDRGRHRTMGLR